MEEDLGLSKNPIIKWKRYLKTLGWINELYRPEMKTDVVFLSFGPADPSIKVEEGDQKVVRGNPIIGSEGLEASQSGWFSLAPYPHHRLLEKQAQQKIKKSGDKPRRIVSSLR
jgi:hypothetical protein